MHLNMRILRYLSDYKQEGFFLQKMTISFYKMLVWCLDLCMIAESCHQITPLQLVNVLRKLCTYVCTFDVRIWVHQGVISVTSAKKLLFLRVCFNRIMYRIFSVSNMPWNVFMSNSLTYEHKFAVWKRDCFITHSQLTSFPN